MPSPLSTDSVGFGAAEEEVAVAVGPAIGSFSSSPPTTAQVVTAATRTAAAATAATRPVRPLRGPPPEDGGVGPPWYIGWVGYPP